MRHTSPYIYKRIELFDHGRQSDYYWDIPVYTILCDADQVQAYIQILADLGKRSWNLDKPHVVENALREKDKDQYYVASIEEAQNKFTVFLKNNADRSLWPCTSEEEAEEAKRKSTCKKIFCIWNQTVLILSTGAWLSYPMSQYVPKKGTICLNELTGKYFEALDTPPYLLRWPGDQELSIEEYAGAGIYEIKVNCNISEAKYSVDDGKTWYSVGTILRVNPGVYNFQFSSLDNYLTPDIIQVAIANKNSEIKPFYKPLYNIRFISNQEDARVKLINSDLWYQMPHTFSLIEGDYSFEFSDIPFYTKPENADIVLNKNTEIEARYSQILYTLYVSSNVVGAKATILGETKALPAKFVVPHGLVTIKYSEVEGYKAAEDFTIFVDSNREIIAEYSAISLRIMANLSGGYCRIGQDSSFPIPAQKYIKAGTYTLTFTPPEKCIADPSQITIDLKDDMVVHAKFLEM